ncbi:MAG: hypothetical protein RSD40_04855, partial [Bacilli bacterium]
GFDFWVMRFNLREKLSGMNGFFEYGNIGIPVNGNDVWTKQISVEEWEDSLLDYDYLVLYNIDEDFIKLYQSLFASKESIKCKTVYKIEKQKSKVLLREINPISLNHIINNKTLLS